LISTKHLIVIAGPTAVGKTKLSIQLAKDLKTEIISADSRQFYKEMSIGTAKPSIEEREGITHHFIDCISIEEHYSAGKYENDVINLLSALFKKLDVVILCGGSGLFIDAVCDGFDEMETIDPSIREELNQQCKDKGIVELQQMLLKLDPEYYKVVDLNNAHRIIRGLEVCIGTGKTYTSVRKHTKKVRAFNIHKIALNLPRENLYIRINERVDEMMKQGLLEEVKGLEKYKNNNALRTVGYKEIFKFINNEYWLNEAVDSIKQNTRRFAKRQLTWFRNDPEYHFIEANDYTALKAYVESKIHIRT